MSVQDTADLPGDHDARSYEFQGGAVAAEEELFPGERHPIRIVSANIILERSYSLSRPLSLHRVRQVWEEEQTRRRADGETFDANGVIHLD